jgi:hypothetical protein
MFVTVFRCPPSIFEKVQTGQKSTLFVGEFVSLSVTDLVTGGGMCSRGWARTELWQFPINPRQLRLSVFTRLRDPALAIT